MKKNLLAFLVALLFAATYVNAQNLNIGFMVMPQQSLYHYSNAFAPQQRFKAGMAAGLRLDYQATDYFGLELQTLYSFEKHEYNLPAEINNSGTNNYVKIAVLNNFYAFNPSAKCRVVVGVGPQVSRLTQANARILATDKIITFYDATAKTDVGIVGSLGISAAVTPTTLLTFGFRYDRGFIQLIPDSYNRVYNSNIGFYIAVAARKTSN